MFVVSTSGLSVFLMAPLLLHRTLHKVVKSSTSSAIFPLPAEVGETTLLYHGWMDLLAPVIGGG